MMNIEDYGQKIMIVWVPPERRKRGRVGGNMWRKLRSPGIYNMEIGQTEEHGS